MNSPQKFQESGNERGSADISNIEALSFYHVSRRKWIHIAYSGCVVVAIVVKHAKRMRPLRPILPSGYCTAVRIFSIFVSERTRFLGKRLLNFKVRYPRCV